MFTTIKDVTLSFGSMQLSGAVQHLAEKNALVFSEDSEPDMTISVNLEAYGLVAKADTVFVKDWSENEGLTASLVEAGVVEIVRELTVGPFSSRAYEVRVLAASFANAEMAGV